jgi:hypothetical protein
MVEMRPKSGQNFPARLSDPARDRQAGLEIDRTDLRIHEGALGNARRGGSTGSIDGSAG